MRIFLSVLIVISSAWANAEERFGDLLDCPYIIDTVDHSGQTFLSFMESTVKPELDYYATEGYEVRGDAILTVLDSVDTKVRRKALRSGRKASGLEALAEALDGQTVNLYSLPDLIKSVGSEYSRGRYDLSTYVGLASCGGAIVRFADDNYAYNIHYGTGDQPKDERTGRSFGAGPGRMANDASDKAYLTDLEEYLTEDSENIEEFYKTLFMALTNTDTSNYGNITDSGQAVLTDFLAVYIAEQDRNLMDGKVYPHWDAALLEVTLISAFHAGQSKIKMFYNDPTTLETSYTSTVYNQRPGCLKDREKPLKEREAHLKDYWQFSRSQSEEHCRRSGINITKEQFRALGQMITEYELIHNPKLVNRLKTYFRKSRKENVFYSLSKFLISLKTEKELGEVGKNLTKDYVAFLNQVLKDAPEINAFIEAQLQAQE